MKRTRKRSHKKTEVSQENSDEFKNKYRKLSNGSKEQEQRISPGHSRKKRSRSCNEQDIEREREPKRRLLAEERIRYQGQKRYRTSSHDEEEQVMQKRPKLSPSPKLGQKSERKSAVKSDQTSPPRKQALKRSRECDHGEQLMQKRPKFSSSSKLGQKSERKSAGKGGHTSPPRKQARKRSREYDEEEKEQVRQKKIKISPGKQEEEKRDREEIGEKKCFKKENKPTSDDECVAGVSGQSVVEPKTSLPLSFHGYRFHKVLGQGSFGKVVLASTKDTGQVVALKVIKKDKVKEKTIQREERILKMASGSPFLCQGLAAFQTQEEASLVMEHVPGGSLRSYMAGKECLPMGEARFFSSNLVCGIQYLHSRGILHRDLKPDNILLGANGYLKIADFGLSAENIFTETTTRGQAGTLNYMAPEVLSSKPYGQSADWWSFGVILCRMITGQYPFNTSLSRQEFIEEVLNMNPRYPTWLCSIPTDLLDKLLDKDPNARAVAGRNIREHPFYTNTNWKDLEGGKVTCPFLSLLTKSSMACPSQSRNVGNERKEEMSIKEDGDGHILVKL
ncbi:protein kinase C delta type-like [Pelobates fuscus]|uniref:protein kinase C delta type-like n=1 Tax=Pelobates fuscus TaxID=191477 RepID=UPI002FE4A8AB